MPRPDSSILAPLLALGFIGLGAAGIWWTEPTGPLQGDRIVTESGLWACATRMSLYRGDECYYLIPGQRGCVLFATIGPVWIQVEIGNEQWYVPREGVVVVERGGCGS